jgi:hypothetical protein
MPTSLHSLSLRARAIVRNRSRSCARARTAPPPAARADLYSINYHHQGDGKTWYGVPGYYAPEFERAMAAAALQQRRAAAGEPPLPPAAALASAANSAAKYDILTSITTVVSPAQLVHENVPVYRLLQEPGEFVVTFPQSYHSGFSHGWNMAEATNFALADWLPFGRRAVERYRAAASTRTSCFSHEQLVCSLALNREDHSPGACVLIADELRRIVEAEEAGRHAAKREGTESFVYLTNESDPRYECAKCRAICYLSALLCRCEGTRVPKRLVSCLRHSRALCDCSAASKVLCFWYKMASLRACKYRASAPDRRSGSARTPLSEGRARLHAKPPSHRPRPVPSARAPPHRNPHAVLGLTDERAALADELEVEGGARGASGAY